MRLQYILFTAAEHTHPRVGLANCDAGVYGSHGTPRKLPMSFCGATTRNSQCLTLPTEMSRHGSRGKNIEPC